MPGGDAGRWWWWLRAGCGRVPAGAGQWGRLGKVGTNPYPYPDPMATHPRTDHSQLGAAYAGYFALITSYI